MTEAFKDVHKIHDARPIAGKPGWVKGWIKNSPTIISIDGKLSCDVSYIYGEWNTFLYEPCPSAT